MSFYDVDLQVRTSPSAFTSDTTARLVPLLVLLFFKGHCQFFHFLKSIGIFLVWLCRPQEPFKMFVLTNCIEPTVKFVKASRGFASEFEDAQRDPKV